MPGALSLEPGQLDARLDQLVADTWPGADRAHIPLVAYCYGPTCTRSRNGLTLAARRGFQNLLWYKEGIQGWRSVGELTITNE